MASGVDSKTGVFTLVRHIPGKRMPSRKKHTAVTLARRGMCSSSLYSPRSERHTRYDLAELLTVAVCAVLSGVDDFVDIELWAEVKIDWLRGFMKLEHGIPSHGTIGRVFGMIAPDEFESAFRRWVGMVVPALAGDTVVAIDGKTSRRSGSKSKTEAGPLHLVSAFAAGMGIVLGQTATTEKSNEITAIPELLAKLAIEGCVVTIDSTRAKIGRTWPASRSSSASASWVITPAPSVSPTSAACPPTPNASLGPYAVIGRSKIGCAGVWMWSSMRINRGYAAAMPPTTWPSFAAS